MNEGNSLTDLGKWQASSHPDLAKCKPDELFPSDFAGRYHRLHEDLWYRFIRLHGTISTIEELRRLFDTAHSLFGAISFGSAYITLAGDLIPGWTDGQPRRSCLSMVLDAVLRESHVVQMPERRGEWWSENRKHMNAAELQLLNELRRRIGLPEA